MLSRRRRKSVELSDEIDRLLDEILTADPSTSRILAERVLALVEQAEG
jgi:predicted transcriptional regulator